MSHLQAGRLNYVLGHRELSLFHQILDPSNMLHPEMQQSYYDYDEIREIQIKSAYTNAHRNANNKCVCKLPEKYKCSKTC